MTIAVGGGIANVKDYGAIGDGVADDTAAIQAAIDAVFAAGGGIVEMPPGNYLCNDVIDLESNVWLRGAGIGATTVTNGNTSAGEWTFGITTFDGTVTATAGTDKINITLSDFTFDFDSGNTGWINNYAAIFVSTNNQSGAGNAKIIENLSFRNIAFVDPSPAAKLVTSDMWGIMFRRQDANEGLFRNFEVDRCSCEAWHTLVQGAGTMDLDGFRVTNCYAYHNDDSPCGMLAANGGNSTAAYNMRNCVVANNTFIGSGNVMIAFGHDGGQSANHDRCSNIAITGNTIIFDSFEGEAVSPNNGILIQPGYLPADNITIANNAIYYQTDSPATTRRGILIGRIDTGDLGLSAGYTQPAVDAAVTITFTVDPDLSVGTWLRIGDSADEGGNYEVSVINGAGSYDVILRDDGITPKAPTSTSIPSTVDVRLKPMCRNLVITGNTVHRGRILCQEVTGGVIANNIVESDFIEVWDAIDVVIQNNVFTNYTNTTVPRIKTFENARVFIRDNLFRHTASNVIQLSAADDYMGRNCAQEGQITNNHCTDSIRPILISQTEPTKMTYMSSGNNWGEPYDYGSAVAAPTVDLSINPRVKIDLDTNNYAPSFTAPSVDQEGYIRFDNAASHVVDWASATGVTAVSGSAQPATGAGVVSMIKYIYDLEADTLHILG